jgi:hypothetical protein
MIMHAKRFSEAPLFAAEAEVVAHADRIVRMMW